MVHPLVNQLNFTRSKWVEGLRDVTAEDAVQRFESMNCMSWMVGHLAAHEQSLWVKLPSGGELIVPELNAFGFGQPASTPDIAEMWLAWDKVITRSDEYLITVTGDMLSHAFEYKGRLLSETVGTMLHRLIYHYWYHLGEALAIRQMLGHQDLPQFVGHMSSEFYYQGE